MILTIIKIIRGMRNEVLYLYCILKFPQNFLIENIVPFTGILSPLS